ncbi:MAG: aminopeptidase P family protein [Armatimonadetes bacterium]|nr:aminopeptidase P family protein [Armatimonadota bacterium]
MIAAEKRSQAVDVLRELDLDVWLLVGRETEQFADPYLRMLVDTHVTWVSCFLVHRSGQCVAIVGTGDVASVERAGGWDVRGYVKSASDPLRAVLETWHPRTIAVNFSTDNFVADGLTHGLYKWLELSLRETPYWERVVSGEPVSSRVRGRKSAAEVARVEQAAQVTETIFDALSALLRPGVAEKEVARYLHAEVDRRGLETAWHRESCPRVTAGPNSPIGHVGPTDARWERGTVLNVDFGVRVDGYCSDLQRTWYALAPHEAEPPADVRDAFALVWRALDAGAAALRPGAAGWEVDAAGRDVFAAAGLGWEFALGHQLGRMVHDGGGVLGPRWERYGDRPLDLVEAGQVYTLEIGLPLARRGFVSIEEDLVVTASGCLFLSRPQRSLWGVASP